LRVPEPDPRPAGGGVAFLLSQLGSFAAGQFATALAPHDLTPPYAGILRLLRMQPGLSQQRLAELLGLAPSRMVAYIDELEQRGWITRTRDPVDRRSNILTITELGGTAFASIAAVGREHERRITAGLSEAERSQLAGLLAKLAALRGLTPGVHPGYRAL
jgi:DNA-binding MarR family transcriptional regulator